MLRKFAGCENSQVRIFFRDKLFFEIIKNKIKINKNFFYILFDIYIYITKGQNSAQETSKHYFCAKFRRMRDFATA